MKKFILALLTSIITLTSSIAAHAKDPIVFVHGYSGIPMVNWTYMVNKFKGDGWPSSYVRTYSYNSVKGVKYAAEKLRDKVNEAISATGKAKWT